MESSNLVHFSIVDAKLPKLKYAEITPIDPVITTIAEQNGIQMTSMDDFKKCYAILVKSMLLN